MQTCLPKGQEKNREKKAPSALRSWWVSAAPEQSSASGMPINQKGWEQGLEVGQNLTLWGESNFRSNISTLNTFSGSSSPVNAVTNGNRLKWEETSLLKYSSRAIHCSPRFQKPTMRALFLSVCVCLSVSLSPSHTHTYSVYQASVFRQREQWFGKNL